MGMTWLEKRNARKAREAAEAARLADVVEGSAVKDLARDIGAKLTKAGHALVEESKAKREERERVKALLDRDKAYHAAEIVRAAAEIDLENGKSIAIVDAVIEPTPEWIAKGDVSTFTPRLEDGTVKTVRGYRRSTVSVPTKLCFDGKITDEQLAACLWYALIHEFAGVSGRYKTSSISLDGNVGGGGGVAQHPMAAHENEAQAREMYRLARLAVNPRFLPVFEFVVISGMSLRAAATAAKRDNSRLLQNFRHAAQAVADFCAGRKIDMTGAARRRD